MYTIGMIRGAQRILWHDVPIAGLPERGAVLDISGLLGKRFEAVKDSIPKATRISFENAFKVEYTRHSTAIEGNTFALEENIVKDNHAPLMNYQLMKKN